MKEDLKWFVVTVLAILSITWTAIYGNVVLDNYVDRCWDEGKVPQEKEPLPGTTYSHWVCNEKN